MRKETFAEGAIRGLMMLGRTREEAEKEYFKNQERRDRDYDDRPPRDDIGIGY